ncbi:MAG: hypothetical protein EHM47_12860 [Ignavibacteriales bacterium]|nr:MAG: hypothetical protein EHM47_12860 [Ignavibacteriales bacterium]
MKHYYAVLILLICTSVSGQTGKISGLMFGDYFYNISRDPDILSLSNTVLSGEKDFNGFQFRRIYLTYDYKISEVFDTRLRVEADQSSNTSNGKIGIAVKDAYLRWKNIFKGSDVIIGLQPPPAFEISESIWAYRTLEKTILDLRGIVSSRDLGISLRGKLDNSGSYNYWFMVGNNSGNSPETDKYKRFYGHFFFKPGENIFVTVYGDLKLRPSFTVNSITLNNNDITTSVFAGYNKKEKYAAGIEGFLQLRENGFSEQGTNSLIYRTKQALGISAFGSYNFSPHTSAVIRFDHFDPNIDTDYKSDSRNYFIFSFVYKPEPVVFIMPNVLIETYESSEQGSYDASVTGRITFYYTFL